MICIKPNKVGSDILKRWKGTNLLFFYVGIQRPSQELGLHEPVSNLNKLFLGKPPGDSLQVFRVHSFANNYHVALLESVEVTKMVH